MTSYDPLNVLYAHDRWASEQLLNACKPLADAQLDRPFEMGRGSLRKTLVHLLTTIWAWNRSILRQSEDQLIQETSSVDALLEAHRAYYDEIQANANGNPNDMLHLSRGPFTMDAPRGAVLTHVFTHGTHHRAQALNMLRHLNVTPLPKSSVLEWMLSTGAADLQQAPAK